MKLNQIKIIFSDFDGVLTDNKVYLNEEGLESVLLNRSDGLAVQILKKNNIKILVVSTESNIVVSKRCKKINVECHQSIENKEIFIKDYLSNQNLNKENCIYIGNDLNDYSAMKIFKNTFCPSDSHKLIKSIATKILKCKGGDGVLMEIIENIDGIDLGINL